MEWNWWWIAIAAWIGIVGLAHIIAWWVELFGRLSKGESLDGMRIGPFRIIVRKR